MPAGESLVAPLAGRTHTTMANVTVIQTHVTNNPAPHDIAVASIDATPEGLAHRWEAFGRLVTALQHVQGHIGIDEALCLEIDRALQGARWPHA